MKQYAVYTGCGVAGRSANALQDPTTAEGSFVLHFIKIRLENVKALSYLEGIFY
jgi:hypothetical protein